ncbi:MAG: hypothetical protein JXQ69_08490 [Paludibacteraceae bacterium]|nr:hypothetical protein [Paludibacteraceae bacterium]MBN2788343.1 hypothetical protein [Paludibacteraceae bacterium]
MKKLTVVLILMISCYQLVAQTDKIDSLLNDLVYNYNDPLVLPEKAVKYDFFSVGTNYSNKTFYAGREIGDNMYTISGHLFYYNAIGLFVSASGNWLSQISPSYSNTTITGGYSKSIDKKKLFTFRTSYSRFLYNATDTISNYLYNNNFNIGFSFRKNWIGARVSGNLLFGEEYLPNLSTSLYTKFTLIKLGKYNKIYSTPELTAFFSNETFYTTDLTNTKTVFGLLNTQLTVPLIISISDFDVEFSYSLNLPFTQEENVTYPIDTYFTASISYMLPIAKKIRK